MEYPVIEVFEIPRSVVDAVLHSDEWFDGMHFDEDGEGHTRIYWYGGLWSLQLFFIKLAQAVGGRLDSDSELESIYQGVGDLCIDMSMPFTAPKFGPDYYYVVAPNIKIKED